MEEAFERGPRRLELSRTQQLNRAIEIGLCFPGRLGRDAPSFLQLAHSAIRFAPPRKNIYELQSNGEIRWRNRKYVPQPILVSARGGAIGLPGFELG
jgi:hypothetical protein